MDRRPTTEPLKTAEDWLDAYGSRLVLYARQWIPRHADAEDVFQDGFLRFWRNGRNADDPKAYLYRCVRSAAIDKLRQLKRRRVHEEAYQKQAQLRAHAEQDEDSRELIEYAMATLTTEQRELIVMKHWGGLTFESIGRVLEIAPRTAQSRYRAALGLLRKTLEESNSL